MKSLIKITAFILLTATPAAALDCADGFRAFAHAAGEDCIPANPERIVTLQDQNGLLPLLELGVTPVGSAGHITEDGPVFRRLRSFDATDVAFIGSYREPDVEAVAALVPDLIIATPWPEGAYETYSRIAPTIIIDMFSQPMDATLLQFADAVGRMDEAKVLQAQFEAEIATIRQEIDDVLPQTTVSFVEYWDNTISGVPNKQSLSLAIPALDIVRTPYEQTIDDWVPLSVEILGNNPSDIMILIANADDQIGSMDPAVAEFMANPVVQATEVAKAGQVFAVDSKSVYGTSWGSVLDAVRAFAEVIGQDGINRDLVVE